MTTEAKDHTTLKDYTKSKGCFSLGFSRLPYIIILFFMMIMIRGSIVGQDSTRKIHPDYNYALSIFHEFKTYNLTSTRGHLEPEWLDCIGIQGICLNDDDLYLEYHDKEFYHLPLDKFEILKLKKLPAHIKLIEPSIFWESLEK